jgi:hypothetical protein
MRGSKWASERSLWLAAAAALVSSCSSGTASNAPAFVSIVPSDCHGSLAELARFPETFPVTGGSPQNNNLTLANGTLFVAYAFGVGVSSELTGSGGIIAVSTSTGAYRSIGAADPNVTSQWSTDSFWVSGDQILLQAGTGISSIPSDPATPSVLVPPSMGCSAVAHDEAFAYCAQRDDLSVDTLNHMTVTKTPIAGGAPVVLVDESLPNLDLGGMADAGDAVLLQLRWHAIPESLGDTLTAVWRIPKDGTPHSDARPDVKWADALFPQWLAWDGANIFGAIDAQNVLAQARVSASDSSPPELVKLWGGAVTRRGDEILSLQTVDAPDAGTDAVQRVVASSKGAPAGSVVACGASGSIVTLQPAGIVADDSGIYVSYLDGHNTIVARVAQ